MLAFAALPLLLSLAPVSGGDAQSEVQSLPDLVSTFGAICLDQINDPAAQASVAIAAPWGFEAEAKPGEFSHGAASLFIDSEDHGCAVTTRVPAAETVETLQAALADLFPLDSWQPMPDADSRYVMIALSNGGGEFVISFKISSASGQNLATLYVVKRKDT